MKALVLLAGLACAGAAAQVPQIGRLFTTAAERQQLDQARQRGASDAVAAPAAAPPPVVAPPPLVVSGFVKRSSGAATSWVNGEVRGSSADGFVVRTPDGRTITVKPGQQYDPASGRVRDVPIR